jgi:class 3 adenylate cyclase
MGCILLAHEDKVNHTAADLKLLTTLALQTSSAIESALLYERRIREAEEREQAMREVHNVTMKFVPYGFIKSLGREKLVDVQLGDQVQREVTVLFLDIRDYTSLSENMTPEENFQFVTSFNKGLGPIIRQHGGFINQYLGDGIMALFPNNAAQALSASIDILNSLKQFNEQRIDDDLLPIRIGIGMHTGPLIMGITGDAERLDAATISDTVNTASRIESLSKHFGVTILLSEATLSQFENEADFKFRYLGKVQVKGKQKPVKIYECFSGDHPDSIQKKIEILPAFEKGLKFYFQRDFINASQAFQQVLASHPHDKPTILFQSNADKFAQLGVSKEWEGVELMDRK